MGVTILHDKNDDLPIFLLDSVNIELELNKTANNLDFIDVQCTDVDELYAAQEDPSLSSTRL